MTGLQTPLFACKVSKRLLPLPALLASCLAMAAASSSCCAFSQASSRCVGCSSVPPLTKRDMATLLPAGLAVRVGVEGGNTLVTGQTLEVNLEWLKANFVGEYAPMRLCLPMCRLFFERYPMWGVEGEGEGRAEFKGKSLGKSMRVLMRASRCGGNLVCRRRLSCQSILHTHATHLQCGVDDGQA
jgi:hypothetical protein